MVLALYHLLHRNVSNGLARSHRQKARKLRDTGAERVFNSAIAPLLALCLPSGHPAKAASPAWPF
jgi:hypothetical protein